LRYIGAIKARAPEFNAMLPTFLMLLLKILPVTVKIINVFLLGNV
jgi:hypothetical protein